MLQSVWIWRSFCASFEPWLQIQVHNGHHLVEFAVLRQFVGDVAHCRLKLRPGKYRTPGLPSRLPCKLQICLPPTHLAIPSALESHCLVWNGRRDSHARREEEEKYFHRPKNFLSAEIDLSVRSSDGLAYKRLSTRCLLSVVTKYGHLGNIPYF